MSTKIKLIFFDFDGVISDSPEPEDGIAKWVAHHKKPYPHKGGGWWSKSESLDLDVFDIQPIETIREIYKNAGEEVIKVLLTDRMIELEPQVKAVLAKHDIQMDYLSLKRGWKNTKGQRIERFLRENIDVTEVEFYDDQERHFESAFYLHSKFPTVNIKFFHVIKGEIKEV